jgi:electron transport complex protein RnfE
MNMPDRNSNSDLIVILGLCPLVAKSTTLLTGITMGFSALLILLFSIVCVSSCRRYIPPNLSLSIILIISVTWVSVLDLLLQAYWFEMRQVLGIYIPLLAMNSFVLLSLEQTALRNSPVAALTNSLRRGSEIFCIVTLVGALREIFGQGSLLSDAKLLPGNDNSEWSFVDGGYTLLLSAPGALLGLGLLIAAYRQIERRRTV